MSRRRVFAWLTGQLDNIGDSALRRAYAEALAECGEVTAWAGDPNAGYVSGLGLEGSAISPTFAAWRRDFAHAVRHADEVVFAFNAGEFVVTREYFFGMLRIAPTLIRMKSRGGSIFWLGAAIRQTRRGFTFPFVWLARAAGQLRWRDTASSNILRVRADVMPDWAFALAGRGDERDERPLLAICLRGDRDEPTEAWITAVRAAALRLNLRLVVVVQVERDAPLARRLAKRWSAEVIDWRSDSHMEQERIVRDVYRRAAAIVSDRLHALVIASTEGAVPYGWTTTLSAKVGKHFDAVGLHGVAMGGRDAVAALGELGPHDLGMRRGELEATMVRARRQLDGVRAAMKANSEGRVTHDSGVSGG